MRIESKDGPPIDDGRADQARARRAAAADLRFVEAAVPLLDPEAIDRAHDMRLKPDDLVRPARLLPIRGQNQAEAATPAVRLGSELTVS